MFKRIISAVFLLHAGASAAIASADPIYFECLKTDGSGIKWRIQIEPKLKSVDFFTILKTGHINSSGPFAASTINQRTISWSHRDGAGHYWSQTVWTIDRAKELGDITITNSDNDPPWTEHNIPCKQL